MVAIFSVLSISSAIIAFFMGSMVFVKNPRSPLNTVFLLMCYSVSYWGFTEYHYRSANDFDLATFWLHMNFIWPFAAALALNFALIFTEKTRILHNPLFYIGLYLPATVFSALVLFTDTIATNPVKRYWGWTFGAPSTWGAYVADIWIAVIAMAAVIHCFLYYRRLPRGR